MAVFPARGVNVLFHSHINPYGLFPLDLSKWLGITKDALEIDNYTEDMVLAMATEEELA
jgi:hypothetical protein